MKLIDLIEAKKENSVVSFMKNVVYDTPAAVYTELSNIRQVATKANMMCCPVEYFDMDNALKGEMFDYFDDKKAVVNSILNFQKYFAEKADVYVLSPLQFYDVNKHIKSSVDKDIYCPQYEQAFFAINALIPTLRQTENRLSNLEGIQRQMQETAARSIKIEDPMLFAIPKGKTVYSDVNAIIGTCWGKDISSSVIKSLNLKGINHKLRKDIISTYKEINVSSIEIAKQEELKLINEMINNQEQLLSDYYAYIDNLQKLNYSYEGGSAMPRLIKPEGSLILEKAQKEVINIRTEINKLQEKKSAIYQKYSELQS
jgi:hypothetical protein